MYSFSFQNLEVGSYDGVLMKVLFQEDLRDPDLLYLIVPLCSSIAKVTSWSKMAALPSANILKFQPSGKKE